MKKPYTRPELRKHGALKGLTFSIRKGIDGKR
jgi:hypothetical protein